MSVEEIYVYPSQKKYKHESDDEDLDDDVDPDLVTSIDRDRIEKKKNEEAERQKKILKEKYKSQKQKVMDVHKKWESKYGDIHSYVKLLGTYFEYKNTLIASKLSRSQIEKKITEFASAFYLNRKSIGEIDNMCSQLCRIMEGIIQDQYEIEDYKINISNLSPPTGEQETKLS